MKVQSNKDYECSCKGFQLIVNYYFFIISPRITGKIFIQNFVLYSYFKEWALKLQQHTTDEKFNHPLLSQNGIGNGNEMFGLNFHLSIILFTTILFLNYLHAGSHFQTLLFIL